MQTVAIIGAGIAGLTAGFRLSQLGVDVQIYESSERPGGVIHSEWSDGYLVEHGPNSIQARTKEIETLVSEAGLDSARMEAPAEAERRYVVRDGKLVPIPASPPDFLKSPLFSGSAKLRLLREPFIRPSSPDMEESVAAFVRRRLGPEFLDYAINPFVAGVYAGNPDRLSMRHAFPRLYQIEQQYGSLIKGMVGKARENRNRPSAMPRGRMFSFQDGLGTLPLALSGALKDRLHLGVRIVAMERSEFTWTLKTQGEKSPVGPFDAILYTAPLHTLPGIDLGPGPDLAPLERVYYPPISVVALGFRREEVEHPLDGFGMLVPEVESRFHILGTLFSSTLFPNRAPSGHVLLTTFVGGARRASLADAPEDDIRTLVLTDLKTLLGVRAEPSFFRRIFWKKAIPQYELGYGNVRTRLDQIERARPGLFFAGAFRSGISVTDTVTSALEVANRVAGHPHR